VTDAIIAAFAPIRGTSRFPVRPQRPTPERPVNRESSECLHNRTPIRNARVGRGAVLSYVNHGLHIIESSLGRGQISNAGTAK
jgi:hypothetical protein